MMMKKDLTRRVTKLTLNAQNLKNKNVKNVLSL